MESDSTCAIGTNCLACFNGCIPRRSSKAPALVWPTSVASCIGTADAPGPKERLARAPHSFSPSPALRMTERHSIRQSQCVLVAEDRPNDDDLGIRTLTAGPQRSEVVLVQDGAAALDCLFRRGPFAARNHGSPALVLLDLKMPKVDGMEVLRQLKASDPLRIIPVVMFTSSREERDVVRCYQLGANAYVVKPVDFREFVTVLEGLAAFWIAVNETPLDAA